MKLLDYPTSGILTTANHGSIEYGPGFDPENPGGAILINELGENIAKNDMTFGEFSGEFDELGQYFCGTWWTKLEKDAEVGDFRISLREQSWEVQG